MKSSPTIPFWTLKYNTLTTYRFSIPWEKIAEHWGHIIAVFYLKLNMYFKACVLPVKNTNKVNLLLEKVGLCRP